MRIFFAALVRFAAQSRFAHASLPCWPSHMPSACTLTLMPHERTLPPMTDTRPCVLSTRVRRIPCKEFESGLRSGLHTCGLHVCNLLRKPDSNFKARDSSRVQMVAAHAPTSCTDKPVSPLALLHLLVSRILQHCATVAKSARPQSQLAEHCSRAFVVFAAC